MPVDDPELNAALQTVFKRSQTDKTFRHLCLTDPIKAIEVATGLRLEGKTIRFVETEVAEIAAADDDRATTVPDGRPP
jgi:hypothetical protein